MSKGPEKKIEDAAVRYAHSIGIRTIRLYFGPGMRSGWPDDVFLIPGGRALFIEFKAPGKRPTALQESKIRLLKKDGYDVFWTDNLFQAKRIIYNALRKALKRKKDDG